MDNLTHTLIGLVAGEAVARNAPAHSAAAPTGGLPEGTRRTALLVTGMVGGNLPDSDLLWSMAPFVGDRVTYVVEHRGYTHTIVGCLALAGLLYLGTWLCLRWRRHRLATVDHGLLASMSLLAVMLHLSMDALNEYGVHPFWPWNSNWYYGDAVFIVEPTYWLAVAPILYGMRTRLARANLWLALFAGCIAVLAFHRFALWWWSLPLAAVLLVLAGRRLQPGRAPVLGVVLILAITAVFIIARGVASDRAGWLARRQFPDFQTLDVMLSPAPAHPFCWDTMLIQRSGDKYVARQGQLSLLPKGDGTCARQIAGEGATAPFRKVPAPDEGGIHWLGEFSMSRQVLLQVSATNCDTLRVTTFLRAPFAAETPGGWMLGDLRYDREPGAGFAETLVRDEAPRRCARDVPWIPPRRDLGLQFLRQTDP